MATTYDKIATTTLSSTSATITFSSIAASWTDLRLVFTCSTTANADAYIRFNSDSATNYSYTYLAGDGTAASSARATSATYIYGDALGATGTNQMNFFTWDIFSYAGSTYKTALATSSMDKNGSGNVNEIVGLWRNTAAITSIVIAGGTYNIGSSATLYGILKA